MNEVLAVAMGISLAACAGLRAFMPLLAVGLAAHFGILKVQPWLAWVGSTEAIITFGVATVLEVLGDKIPIVDHALDAFHTVARPIAGAIAAMAAFTDLSPTYAMALGIIVGAPVAGGLHLGKAGTRVASTATTAGLGNPILSVLEDIVAVLGVILALIAPIVTLIVVVIAAVFLARWIRRRRTPAGA